MTSNSKVIVSWHRGLPAKSKHLKTDGVRLWSYNLLVGITGEDGYKYVKNYTAHSDYNCYGRKVRGKFISVTTSKHVGLARLYAYAIPPD